MPISSPVYPYLSMFISNDVMSASIPMPMSRSTPAWACLDRSIGDTVSRVDQISIGNACMWHVGPKPQV